MSAFCSKYPSCGCVGVGTKCYDQVENENLKQMTFDQFNASMNKGMELIKEQSGPSRNRPCPCGSGKKYKHCCADK